MTMGYRYRLHVFLDTPAGIHLHICRDVDTFAQAEVIAEWGHKFDEEDGTSTRYVLYVWELGEDLALLRTQVTL